MEELKKQLQLIISTETPLKPLIAKFQEIEAKGDSVDNTDLDTLDRIYTQLLLRVPLFITETEIFERILKNRKSIEVGKKRSETIDGKKVYASIEDAKGKVELFFETEEIEKIRYEQLGQMYKNATEAVAERIRAIKIFLNYANRQTFNG